MNEQQVRFLDDSLKFWRDTKINAKTTKQKIMAFHYIDAFVSIKQSLESLEETINSEVVWKDIAKDSQMITNRALAKAFVQEEKANIAEQALLLKFQNPDMTLAECTSKARTYIDRIKDGK